MDEAEYEKQLHLLLGVQGPMGFMSCEDGSFQLVYRLPDGGNIYPPPASTMTNDQRRENIESLRQHLGLVAKNRKGPDETDH